MVTGVVRVRVRGWRCAIAVGLAVAVVGSSLSAAGVAGATETAPPGETVPVACPDASGKYVFDGLGDADRFASVWLPAGATLSLSASGTALTSFRFGEFGAEYWFHAYATGGEFGSTSTEVGWGYATVFAPSEQWLPLSATLPDPFGSLTNTTGRGRGISCGCSRVRSSVGPE